MDTHLEHDVNLAVSKARAKQKRVTLNFQSDKGIDYLYDDVTGCIFPWNELRETALSTSLSGICHGKRRALAAIYGSKEVEAAFRFIRRWRENYGAFSRTETGKNWQPVPPPEQLEKHVRSTSFELLLVVTENCNLRCKYCALSKVYPLNRKRTVNRMSFATAQSAVDWYIALVNPQMARNPRKKFGLSFYGGEPMMNMSLIKQLLEYVRKKYPGRFLPVLTTNGTMLTLENVKTLVKHDVVLAVSIDGPKKEHDRLRIDAQGRGSFTRIITNLRNLKSHYPKYWASRLSSVSVYDWGTDLNMVADFFKRNSDIIPRSIFVNQVGSRNTDWYEQYSLTDGDRMFMGMNTLRERYKRAKIRAKPVDSYLDALVGTPIAITRLRRRIYDERPPFLPFSGTCIPGDKIAVHVNGKIDMCERVNGSYPIGHLARGGIDYKQVGKILNQYRSQALYACSACPATKHCGICFALIESSTGFNREERLCSETVNGAKQRLADYISLLEENPQADLHFETDTSRLEERVLLGC